MTQTYTFRDTITGAIIEKELSVSSYDAFKKANPNLERYFDSVPALSFNGRSFGGLDAQTDDTFKERLAKIGDKFPGSPLADRYSKKVSIKASKTKEVFKKHIKKFQDQKRDRLGR